MADQVEVNYEILKEISGHFNNLAGSIEQMKKDVDGKMDVLREQGWQGKGSDAFYREMNDQISPAIQRLQNAMQKTAEIIGSATQAFHEAEAEVQGSFQSSKT